MTALDILLVSFVLLIAGIGGVVKFISRGKHRRLLRELTLIADEEEWSVEETELEGPAICLSGKTPSGLTWRMILAGRDRQGREQSKWICRDLQLEKGAVLVGQVLRGVEVEEIEEELTPEEMRAEYLWQQVLKRLGGDAPEGVKPVEIGSPSLQEHFVVLAFEKRDAEALLDDHVEGAFLEWKRVGSDNSVPLVLFTEQGLELLVSQITNVSSAQQVVTFGEKILERVEMRR